MPDDILHHSGLANFIVSIIILSWNYGAIMRIEHYLFHALLITPISRAKVRVQWGILEPPVACYRSFFSGDFGFIPTLCLFE